MNRSALLYGCGVFVFGVFIAFGLNFAVNNSDFVKNGGQLLSTSAIKVISAVSASSSDDYSVLTESVATTTTDIPLALPAEATLVNESTVDPRTLSGKNIIADLKEMKMFLYQDGNLLDEYPIISKGRPGTAWETIPGTYGVQTKEDNHLSSIGHVWMPYSMQFFGNYFIHGWPYYENGREVPKGFSGGCIRLSTADAKAVYNFADFGTAVHVVGDVKTVSPSYASYTVTNSKKMPSISARSYVVADLDTGEVILEKNKSEVHPTASLAKLMTATIDLEAINQYQNTSVSARAVSTYGDQGDLKEGEILPVKDLIYPLLLESSNDASEVLAEQIGRSHFLELMNNKAKAIGLLNTHFDDPAGLSQETVSTAQDMFKLVQYIRNYKSYILAITKLPAYSAKNHNWHNISRFVNDSNYEGGKNGYTDEAHHTLISLFSLPLSEFSIRHVAFILLDGDTSTKEEDMRSMVDYVSENVFYTPQEPVNFGNN